MNFYDLILIAVGDLRHRLFRTILATLGIICGVASVQASLCIGEGGRRQTMEAIGRLGLNRVIMHTIDPSKLADAKGKPTSAKDDPRYGLGMVDMLHIRDSIPGIKSISGLMDLRARLYDDTGKQADVTVLACSPGYAETARLQIQRGRFLSELDDNNRTLVAVVGTQAARRLFGISDPLTRTLFINNAWYRIVGVATNPEHAQSPKGQPLDEAVFIPLRTALTETPDGGDGRVGASRANVPELESLVLEVKNEDTVLATAHRVERWLNQTGRKDEVTIDVPLAIMQQKATAHRTATLVTALIAGISLLVGGIGIMNIMLANISERRKEIGTRCALGARQRDIMAQFMIEAVVLTGIGGVIGLVAGLGITSAVDHWTTLRTATTPGNLLIGLGSACLTGLIFGLWPARQAAKVNPIEALRSG